MCTTLSLATTAGPSAGRDDGVRMTRRNPCSACVAAAAAAVLLLLPGCKVVYPPGYVELSAKDPHLTAERIPGIGRWELSNSRHVFFDQQMFSRTSGMGFFRLKLRFGVMFEDSPNERLVCSTLPDEPFACRSSMSAGAPWTLAITDLEGCNLKDVETVRTLLNPECWQGNVTTPSGYYDFRFAHLEEGQGSQDDATGQRGRGPIGRVVWTNAEGVPVQALDAVSEVRVKLYRGGALPGDDADALLLSAMALHRWIHCLGEQLP